MMVNFMCQLDQSISSVQFSRSVMSDSLWPHRRQSTRFPHPWDSPGKNTGVGWTSLYSKINRKKIVQFSCSVVSDSLRPPWTAACQASLSITNSQSLLKLMSIESVVPSKHFILCHPLLLLPSIFPSIMVFSNELGLFQWLSSASGG